MSESMTVKEATTMKTKAELATMSAEEKIEMLVSEFANDADIKGVVRDIESRPLTTQNHYGDYMSFLSEYVKNRVTLKIISMSMVRAGANASGVQSAIQILTGGY